MKENKSLVENIVDLKLSLHYLDAAGTAQTKEISADPTAAAAVTTNWPPEGFNDGSISTPNTPTSLTISLTSLRPQGANLFEIGALPLADAIQKHGITHSRTFPISVGAAF